MPPLRAHLVTGVALLGLLACESDAPALPDFWIEDLDRGVELAADSGRPMLVVFR